MEKGKTCIKPALPKREEDLNLEVTVMPVKAPAHLSELQSGQLFTCTQQHPFHLTAALVVMRLVREEGLLTGDCTLLVQV